MDEENLKKVQDRLERINQRLTDEDNSQFLLERKQKEMEKKMKVAEAREQKE